MQVLSATETAYLQQPNHFTVSAVVIEREHILLIHHRRIDAWLPPGGHIEAFELPHQAAIREALEETGVAIEILSDAMPETGRIDALFPPQPLCLHVVTAVEKQESVYHFDLAYLCKVKPLATDRTSSESLPETRINKVVNAARWVQVDRLNQLNLANNVSEMVDLALTKLTSLNHK